MGSIQLTGAFKKKWYNYIYIFHNSENFSLEDNESSIWESYYYGVYIPILNDILLFLDLYDS